MPMPNLSALRRALAEAARGGGRAALRASLGAGPGALAGGAYASATDEDPLEGALIGAGAGASLGAGAPLARNALREALASRVARGVTSREAQGATRAADNFVDPETGESAFGQFRAPPFRRMSAEDLEAAGYGPPSPIHGSPEWENAGPRAFNNRRANPMTQMEEMQAMRNALRQLQIDRRSAADAEEVADIDAQISMIMNQLNM